MILVRINLAREVLRRSHSSCGGVWAGYRYHRVQVEKMASRIITDTEGVAWTIFEVRPAPNIRGVTLVRDELRHGWLCFKPSGIDRKLRLTPIPAGWEAATDDCLQTYLRAAS